MNDYIKDRKWLCILVIVAVLLAIYFIYYHRPTQTAVSTPFTPVTETYLRNANITCFDSALEQLRAYNTDPLADITFDKYKVPVYTGSLVMLNLKTSSKQIVNFKTEINEQLASTGINFAGKYTLVSVGMTGWGLNYFLIDRTTGKGITIHTMECETLENYSDAPERWIDVAWERDQTDGRHIGRLRAHVSHEPAALATVTNVIAKEMGNISNLKIISRSIDFFEILIDIEVRDLRHLNNIIANLRSKEVVQSVERHQT